jgi:hypothetical protein
MNLKIFTLPGCGRVIADMDRDDLPPVIQFEDGGHCFGLPRTSDEVSPMGYESIAEGNFVHEALHLFIAHRCGFVSDSVLHRAANGADFADPDILRDAQNEERIVLGVQIAVNEAEGDGLTTNKVGGFVMHIAGAAREYARMALYDFGCDLEEVKADFIALMDSAGCKDALCVRPKLLLKGFAGVVPVDQAEVQIATGDASRWPRESAADDRERQHNAGFGIDGTSGVFGGEVEDMAEVIG